MSRKRKNKRHETELTSLLPASASTHVGIACLLLAALTGVAYANSFHGVFLMDDVVFVDGEAFHYFWPPWDLLKGPRPIVDLTLAMNYAISRLEPWSYHAFNLAVHILAALTLFGLVRQTLMRWKDRPAAADPTSMAFIAALIWAVHPLQTQAVTYVIQRSESMMGLCYLLTLYCICRSDGSRRQVAWGAAAVVACALGMACKAVMLTAPLVALLYDRTFLSSTWGEVFRKRSGLYLGFFATWSILAFTGVVGGVIATSPDAKSTVGFGVMKFTPSQYAMTQPGVILHYLRLAFWPNPLCLDYYWPAAKGFTQVGLPLIGILLLGTATVWAWFRRPALGFLGAAFFLILAPTSSFIPIQDVAVEHRMYLSLAAIILLVVFAARRLVSAKTPAIVLTAVVVFALGFATYRRNLVYADVATMWRDVIAINPNNARAQNNLATELIKRDDVDEAMKHLDKTLEVFPNAAKAYYNRASALEKKGQYEEVVKQYRESLRLEPGVWVTHYNIANCLYRKLGRAEEAIPEYREAQRLAPTEPQNYIMLGVLFDEQHRLDEAAAEYRLGIAAAGPRTDPIQVARLHFNLANTLSKQNQTAEALDEYTQALKYNPRHHQAQYGIGVSHMELGDKISAVASFRASLAIDPNYGPAKKALEDLGLPATPDGH